MKYGANKSPPKTQSIKNKEPTQSQKMINDVNKQEGPRIWSCLPLRRHHASVAGVRANPR